MSQVVTEHKHFNLDLEGQLSDDNAFLLYLCLPHVRIEAKLKLGPGSIKEMIKFQYDQFLGTIMTS